MKDKIKIDIETGLMIDIVHPLEFGDDIIETPCDIPFYLPKWNGEAWEEGATQEYIDSLKSQLSEPTEADELAILIKEELAKTKLDERVEQVESKTATLAETLEVLFG